MRPPRPDIALPPVPPGVDWVGAGPKRIEQLSARGPLLVVFLELGEPSAVRTVPYLREWHRRYSEHGLSVIGVHTPRLPIAAETPKLRAGLARLGVGFPVANDRERQIWSDYGCIGWPSLFLWRPGGALAWVHFGEGEYAATEKEIRALIAAAAAERELPQPSLPDPLAAMRPEDAPGAAVRKPSDAVAPGGEGEPWSAPGGETIELSYEAGSAYATADGEGEIAIAIDGQPAGRATVRAPGVYELAAHGRHEAHRLRLAPTVGVRLWSIGFGAGVAR